MFLCCSVHSAVSYTHLRAHETPEHLVCRLLLEKKTETEQTRSDTTDTTDPDLCRNATEYTYSHRYRDAAEIILRHKHRDAAEIILHFISKGMTEICLQT